MKRVNGKNSDSSASSSGGGSDQGERAAPPIKLPAALALPKDVVEGLPVISSPPLCVPFGERPSTFQEVWHWQRRIGVRRA